MWPIATILDSSAINDGLNKYQVFFSHIKRNLELGSTGILWVLKGVKKRAPWVFFLAALRVDFRLHDHKMAVPRGITFVFNIGRRGWAKDQASTLGTFFLLLPKRLLIEEGFSHGHLCLQVKYFPYQILLQRKQKEEKVGMDMECAGLQFCHSRHLVNYPIEFHYHRGSCQCLFSKIYMINCR